MSLIKCAFRPSSATSLNQPGRPRLVAFTLLAILAAAFIVAPAYSVPPAQKAARFIEIADQAKAIAEQVRSLAQLRGIDTQQANLLIDQGENSLAEAKSAHAAGNSKLAIDRAREAQASFRAAIALMTAPSLALEGADEAAGLLVAAMRARERIAELRSALTAYQTQVSVDQQSEEAIASVNGTLASAEASLAHVENALSS